MNCRPRASRQRRNLAQFAKLQSTVPGEILTAVRSQYRQAKVASRVTALH